MLNPQQFGKGELYHAEPMSSRGHFLSDKWVHVGTKRAALARVHPELWDDDEGYPQSGEYASGRSRVWQTRLRPSVSIGPLITDQTAGRIEEGHGPPHAMRYDAHPYINEYEDPGSVSYVVKASALYRSRPVGSGPGFITAQIKSA